MGIEGLTDNFLMSISSYFPIQNWTNLFNYRMDERESTGSVIGETESTNSVLDESSRTSSLMSMPWMTPDTRPSLLSALKSPVNSPVLNFAKSSHAIPIQLSVKHVSVIDTIK